MQRAAERDAVAKAGDEFAEKATPITEVIKKPLGDMADSFATLLQQSTEQMNAETRSMDLTMAVTTFAALGIGIFVAVFLSRSISGATQSVLVHAEAIAAGDLTHDDLKVRRNGGQGSVSVIESGC